MIRLIFSDFRKDGLFFLISILFFLSLSALLNSCGKPDSRQESADLGFSSPYPNFRGGEASGERNFEVLINHWAKSKSARTPWAGFWWPYTRNGIASGGAGGSPAGKYDAARGGSSRSQTWEVQNHGAGVKGVQGWWGHCNGWCVAAALFDEPRQTTRVNGIAFSVADQKALLTEAGMEASADFFGNRVDWGRDFNSPKIDDPVPNQFFLVLTNYMGKLREPVLMDRYTSNEVWNQPIAGYEFRYPRPSDYLGATEQAPGVYRIQMNVRIWWANDAVAPDCQTPDFDFQADGYYFQDRELAMELWLDGPVVFDSSGRVVSAGNLLMARNGEYLVGGAWLGASNHLSDGHPDYLWIPYSVIKPTDYQQAYANPELDPSWILEHVIAGKDDPNFTPRPVEPAPIPSATPSGHPNPIPTGTGTPRPSPTPTPTATSTSTPTPTPTGSPRPRRGLS